MLRLFFFCLCFSSIACICWCREERSGRKRRRLGSPLETKTENEEKVALTSLNNYGGKTECVEPVCEFLLSVCGKDARLAAWVFCLEGPLLASNGARAERVAGQDHLVTGVRVCRLLVQVQHRVLEHTIPLVPRLEPRGKVQLQVALDRGANQFHHWRQLLFHLGSRWHVFEGWQCGFL